MSLSKAFSYYSLLLAFIQLTFILSTFQVAYCLQEIKAQKNRDKKIFANMFDKFAKIDAKKEEDYKRREKPIEIK